MSAVKIVFKRSSLLGKRPTGANLDPGEIALNTNTNDPGIFFEVNDGSVVKAGPTSYLPSEPTSVPALGELWVDSDTKTLNIGTESNSWQKVAAPFLGGTNGLTVFVAPEYPNATDSLNNDGQTVPFLTINRAILEITKQVIRDTINGISPGNNRYLIMLAPGRHCVVNRPGVSASSFSVDLSDSSSVDVTDEILSSFNPENVGGLILPRGVSIIGLDLKKCEIHPTYVPKYTHPKLSSTYQQQVNGPIYANQPRSSVFKWSGNTYLSNFTGLDKVEKSIVVNVSTQSNTKYALFKTSRPHGLDYNEFVQISYTDTASQVGSTFREGAYYVNPINGYEFVVSAVSWSSAIPEPVLASALPTSYSTETPTPLFNVSAIYPYYIPEDGSPYELSSYSHHRLSILGNASLQQLNDFYLKVQKAFPGYFGNQVFNNIVSSPETEIVSSTSIAYPNNLSANSTDNSSPYQNMVNHRSDYGMANGDYDGEKVTGFKSVIINSATAVILQRDPAAYEIYSTASQDWIQLTEYTRGALGSSVPITRVPISEQLKNLNSAPIPDIRYYYQTLKVSDSDGNLKSTGITDDDHDFRHFGFRMSGPNSFMQAQSTYTIGAAIGCWAKNGSEIALTNATTNFGSVAFEAEGFAGIGTLGGANESSKGFLQTGIIRPRLLTEDAVVADQQKRILYINSKVVFVGQDPTDAAVQLVYLQRPFDPASILPFSLKPDTAVFVSNSLCTYRGFFVTDGSPTCILSGDNIQNPYATGGAVLRLRNSDSTIPDTPSGSVETQYGIPYIRRFVDPRTTTEKAYGFNVQSSNPTSQSPKRGSVLRLNQTGQNLSKTIKRNYQFDPGIYGGIAQVFTVNAVQTEQYSTSPNFNYKIADFSQDTTYSIYVSLTDASKPWLQTVPSNPADLSSSPVPTYRSQGEYVTYSNKNFYSVENDLWGDLYYDTIFNPLNGPVKVSPDKPDSSYVVSSALQRTELVSDSWQGYVPDEFYNYYINGVPEAYGSNLSYMRGCIVPYSEIDVQFHIDLDDGSDDLGIIFKRLPLETTNTVMVANSVVTQTKVDLTDPYVSSPSIGRPEILELDLLAVQQLVSPKETVSILQLTNSSLNAAEYVRVISLNSNIVQVIRNYYPEYAQGTLPAVWPSGTIVRTCTSSGYPEPSVYDPDWSVTKAAMFRYFQLMGYSRKLIAPYLKPALPGDRVLQNSSIPLSPIDGYANQTTAWPVEFNAPSTITANTHTWNYVGFLDYSRGLPKYQVNQISKKLAYDYLSTSSWGGRLTVTGADENGEIIFLGPVKEALTAKYFNPENPLFRISDRRDYVSPEIVPVPNPVLVFSVDDISGSFNGSTTVFPLSRGGFSVPVTQLSTYGTFVFLGGVVQKPIEAYIIQTAEVGISTPQIVFSEPPVAGTSCDIRIVTSDDQEETLQVIPFNFSESFNGQRTSFTLTPNEDSISELNSFVFLGGVEQNPSGLTQTSAAYVIQKTGGYSELSFVGGAPEDKTTLDVRGIFSGLRYRDAGLSTVYVTSVDDVAPLFNGTLTSFPVKVNGVAVDPSKVNAQNMFVSLGGVMQIPIAQSGSALAGLAYIFTINEVTGVPEITFANPPAAGSTCNIRIVTSEEFVTCPLPEGFADTGLNDGPGIEVNTANQIINIDQGII